MNEIQEIAVRQNLSEPQQLSNQINFYEEARQSYKLAEFYAKAEIIPAQYRNKPADCMIAVDMASRMGVSPIMVMQNLYVVKGKPSWSGQACIAFIRNKFKNVKIKLFGNRGDDSFGCYITAIDNDGNVLQGAPVTLAMARSEGWLNNSKWRNMPDLMLSYRAASFFARVHCPEILMGCQVEGEAEDIQSTSCPKAPDPFAEEESDAE